MEVAASQDLRWILRRELKLIRQKIATREVYAKRLENAIRTGTPIARPWLRPRNLPANGGES